MLGDCARATLQQQELAVGDAAEAGSRRVACVDALKNL